MRIFNCDTCGNPVYFDSTQCVSCGSRLGFVPKDMKVHAVTEGEDGLWMTPGLSGTGLRFCANAVDDVCNWMIDAGESDETFCVTCRHNRIVPVTDNPVGLERFRKISQAQRHLFYSILRWNLPRQTREELPDGGLVFDFLADEVDENGKITPAMTGHEDGLISLRAAEAEDATRESIRVAMNEPYRTLLGHFRHEVGHYYWARLVNDPATLERARVLFGDEREDYAEALRRNYEQGPPADWQNNFISTYASCHPAEDFAECWAHYFHIVDTLETARAFGLSTAPQRHADMAAEVDFNPYQTPDINTLIEAWVPISVALNAMQRSMGQPDAYPFVLNTPVMEKLEFINDLVHGRQARVESAVAA